MTLEPAAVVHPLLQPLHVLDTHLLVDSHIRHNDYWQPNFRLQAPESIAVLLLTFRVATVSFDTHRLLVESSALTEYRDRQ